MNAAYESMLGRMTARLYEAAESDPNRKTLVAATVDFALDRLHADHVWMALPRFRSRLSPARTGGRRQFDPTMVDLGQTRVDGVAA